jgi:hypothetical protein
MRHFPWNHRYINWFSGEYSSRLMLFFASSSVWNRLIEHIVLLSYYLAKFNIKTICLIKYTQKSFHPTDTWFTTEADWKPNELTAKAIADGSVCVPCMLFGKLGKKCENMNSSRKHVLESLKLVQNKWDYTKISYVISSKCILCYFVYLPDLHVYYRCWPIAAIQLHYRHHEDESTNYFSFTSINIHIIRKSLK